MSVLLVYNTVSGNTEKLANGVASELKGKAEITVINQRHIKKVDVNKFSTIILAYWVDKSTMNKKMQKFIDTLNNKDIYLLANSAFQSETLYGVKCLTSSVEYMGNNNLLGASIVTGCLSKNAIKFFKFMAKVKPENVHAWTEKKSIYYGELSNRPNDYDIQISAYRIAKSLNL